MDFRCRRMAYRALESDQEQRKDELKWNKGIGAAPLDLEVVYRCREIVEAGRAAVPIHQSLKHGTCVP